jgi:hypothetical protein
VQVSLIFNLNGDHHYSLEDMVGMGARRKIRSPLSLW